MINLRLRLNEINQGYIETIVYVIFIKLIKLYIVIMYENVCIVDSYVYCTL